ncbi:MAG TPA: hypothetical protein VNR87_06420 [Flavisolibacter sp.]|nr:hypothetical protein [Flavisolibacter sp.]
MDENVAQDRTFHELLLLTAFMLCDRSGALLTRLKRKGGVGPVVYSKTV